MTEAMKTFRLKDNFKPGSWKQLKHGWLNWVARTFNHIKIKPAGRFIREPTGYGTTLDLTGLLAFDKGSISFGCTINDNTKVRIQKGYCYYGKTPTKFNEQTVTCTGSGFIFIKLEYATGVWTNAEFSSTDPDSLEDEDTGIWVLCEVTMVSNVLTNIFVRRSGDIDEPLT